jgi:hypothetical protein
VEVAEQEIEEIVAEKKESFLDGLLDEYRKERKQEIEEYEERKQIEKRRRERYSEDNEQEEY